MGATEDEQACISRSRNGDPEAFEELVRQYQHMIHSLAFRMSGSMADAEDLSQEIFIRAFHQLDSFKGEARFSSWLYRLGINACLNWKKRERRREEVHLQWTAERDVAIPATDESSDENRTRLVQSALMRLPAKQRAAIVLTVYEGMNHAEAARALGCSEPTVSWRVFAARIKLKRWLKPASRGSPGR